MSPASSTLTYLFTDVEGSTSQWETATDMSERVEHHFAILRECVVAGGGEIFATMGDGIGAAFASARAAVDAAVAAQLAMPATGLRVRMGLHTGESQRVGDDFRGRALNRAARIMSSGHGRQILVSDVTATLLRTGPTPASLLDLGVHALRDLAEPEHVWQVLDDALEHRFPPLRGARVTGTGLPRHRTSFVGRERDVCEIVDRIREHPITTLTGTGGAGKTRLAVRAAFEAMADPEGVWFVELAPVTDPGRAGEAVARAAGVDGAASTYDALASTIGTRHALLVLDNCEHVLDEVAAITDRLASDCPNLRILATSREPLLVAGEFVVTVHGLDAATDAVELFEQRAAASGAAIHAGHRPTIERICDRLGGLPLAIELAAARVPMFGLHGVEALLDRPFEVLVTRSRSTDERHRTMFAAIDWSYRLLDHAERRLLEWMAVFVGGFELDAALHVATQRGESEARAADVIDSLVRKSMLEVEAGATHVRYRMLESIRAFALARLAERGEVDDAMALHAGWVAAITDLPFDEPISVAVERSSVRLEREADNWAAAMTTATDLRSTRLIEQLCGPPTAHFLVSRHDLTGVLERAAAVCPDGPARRAVAAALTCASAGSIDPTRLPSWNAELQRLDGDEWSGSTHLIQWIAFVWEQRIEECVQWCIASARTARFTQDTRDLFQVIAGIDRFSLTDSTDGADWLLAGALDVVDRTEVTANRVIGRLAAAWALAPTEPGYALQLVQDAIEEIPALPAFMRATLPGNVSRLMASIDPASGAAYLLERIAESDGPVAFLDVVPVTYAAAMLDRIGHPAAAPVLASLAASPYGTYLARIELDRRARAALLEWSPLGWCELMDLVRASLGELAAAPTTADVTTEVTR